MRKKRKKKKRTSTKAFKDDSEVAEDRIKRRQSAVRRLFDDSRIEDGDEAGGQHQRPRKKCCDCDKRVWERCCKVLTLLSLGMALVSGLYFGSVSIGMSSGADATKHIKEKHGCAHIDDCGDVMNSTGTEVPGCLREFCSNAARSPCEDYDKEDREGGVGVCGDRCAVDLSCENRYISFKRRFRASRDKVRLISFVILAFSAGCCVSTCAVAVCAKKCTCCCNKDNESGSGSDSESDETDVEQQNRRRFVYRL